LDRRLSNAITQRSGSTTLAQKHVYQKRISANPSHNHNSNPKAQWCFRTEEMTSIFENVHITNASSIRQASNFSPSPSSILLFIANSKLVKVKLGKVLDHTDCIRKLKWKFMFLLYR